MLDEIQWLDDALAAKDITNVANHYLVRNKTMMATNDKLLACHPLDLEGSFLVPGADLKRIYERLPAHPKVHLKEGRLHLRAGRFSGSLQLQEQERWRFQEPPAFDWKPFPRNLLPILKDLRPFVSENAVHLWSLAVSVDNGWCYASNNVVLAGAKFPGGENIKAMLPSWVVDFILGRSENLTAWAITDSYMAFKWSNGAWVRSTLIVEPFPEKASELIRNAPPCTQGIKKEYREAIDRVCNLSEEVVSLYADRVEGRTKLTHVAEQLVSEVPAGAECSLWSATHLASIMTVANRWSPSKWPAPVPFEGLRVKGYIAGRMR